MRQLKKACLAAVCLALLCGPVASAAISTSGTAVPLLPGQKAAPSDAEFRGKLTLMLSKIDSSVHELREQIAESQSAPFLSDLYLQLAELLSQRANTLYYVQMEKSGGDKVEGGFSPVVSAQKESIEVYKKILKEFPETGKKPQIHYRLALAFKSIDEIPAFMKAASGVVHDYPGSEEALRSELLLGQYFYEKHDYTAAFAHFAPVASSSFVYERSLARYRMGLIELDREKNRLALDRFEQVITDPMLKEQDNPYSVSLKAKTLKSDLKREALIDSVRAFTNLHGKGGDPVAYYARIAPSELHFQEVIEKLAVRYIYLKNYESAVRLLRTLSERTADAERVVNIYRDVLVMIPLEERSHIPVSEMRFVLGQYRRWSSFYDIPQPVRFEARAFFEKQLRELATRNHSLAKERKGGGQAAEYLARARDYYLLYLGAFEASPESAKMGANLADVYFAQKNWVHSGEYYLRAYVGEFGKSANDKSQLIENAMLCLQKGVGDSFYQTVRRRGLMIRALDLYIAASENRKHDPRLAFLRAKTRYEQGLFPQSLEELEHVAQTFPTSSQAILAGELILDYFNVRNDYDGLARWSARLLGLRLADASFNKKLATIQAQAGSKIVNAQVRSRAGYDEFAQGRSYLDAAMSSQDPALSQVALQEALSKSREEQDILTYLKTARLMGEREKDPAKKTEILESVARENRKVGRYDESLEALRELYEGMQVPESQRNEAYEQAVEVALLMRDWKRVAELSRKPRWGSLSGTTLTQLRQSWNELLESPVEIPDGVASQLAFVDTSEEGELALFKAQGKFAPSLRDRIQALASKRCGSSGSGSSAICRWQGLARLDSEGPGFKVGLAQSPLTLEAVQKVASEFTGLLGRYRALSGSGESELEIAIQLRSEALYQSFSGYLQKVASANPDFKDMLLAKAGESDRSAKNAAKTCSQLATSNLSPASRFCEKGGEPSLTELLSWKRSSADASDPGRADSDEVLSLQKKLFSKKGETAQSELELSKELLEHRDFHRSLALATQGMAENPALAGEFKTLLGCSALGLGYVQEAEFRLKEAKETEGGTVLAGLKEKCSKEIMQETRAEL